MPQYSVITREDEQSILLKNKIIHFLSGYNYTYNEETPETVFVVGGDGTFLKAIHQYVDQLKNLTFIGIHTGTLGFMCDHQKEEIDELLEKFIHQNPQIRSYPMLEVQLHGCNETVYAFNEARIENMVNTLSLDLWINDEYFEKFLGSGICLCSQNGSTAINRSLGGAIIQHRLHLLQLSEIMGIHHWKHRSLRSSLILKEDAIIHVKPGTFKNAMLCYDHKFMHLDDCTAVTIKNSDRLVKVAKYSHYSYLSRLKNVF